MAAATTSAATSCARATEQMQARVLEEQHDMLREMMEVHHFVLGGAPMKQGGGAVAMETMMAAIQKMDDHLGGGSRMFQRVMSKVSTRMEAMQKDTLILAAAVLDPYTHYQINMSKIPDYASALTDAIEKIADPETAVLAINEISIYRECRGRFGQRLAHTSAERMSPTEWWFQFGGEVPNLQKRADPMMEWLNEDEDHIIQDGTDAASAVFEEIRSLNSRRKEARLGREDSSRKRKRVVEEEEEDFMDIDDDEENEYTDNDDEDDGLDGASEADGEEDPGHVGVPSASEADGSSANRRSARVRQRKKVKNVNSLYN